mmetsp:Transcript_7337/g.16804  ORF Transcript_7337/g.16804 Transcript_7337/m.16804 type:complete len:613 (-) Transcript_7337:45-1883(-)
MFAKSLRALFLHDGRPLAVDEPSLGRPHLTLLGRRQATPHFPDVQQNATRGPAGRLAAALGLFFFECRKTFHRRRRRRRRFHLHEARAVEGARRFVRQKVHRLDALPLLLPPGSLLLARGPRQELPNGPGLHHQRKLPEEHARGPRVARRLLGLLLALLLALARCLPLALPLRLPRLPGGLGGLGPGALLRFPLGCLRLSSLEFGEVGLDARRLVALGAQLTKRRLARGLAVWAEHHGHPALHPEAVAVKEVLPRALGLAPVLIPRLLAPDALGRAHEPRHLVRLEQLLRLGRRDLGAASVKEVVLPRPGAALGEGLDVALDAPAELDDLLRLEPGRRRRHLPQQRRRPLAPDPARTVHHHLFPVELLLRFGQVEPAGEVVGVAHLGVDQQSAARRRREVPNRRLVGVSHVDDDRVLVRLRIRHHRVIVERLQVHRILGLQRRGLIPGESVPDKLVHLPQPEALEAVRPGEPVGELEVRLVELGVPGPQPLAEAPHPGRAARQSAVQALRGAPPAPLDVMGGRQVRDGLHGPAVLLLGPHGLHVLVEEDQGHRVRGQALRGLGQRLEGNGLGILRNGHCLGPLSNAGQLGHTRRLKTWRADRTTFRRCAIGP